MRQYSPLLVSVSWSGLDLTPGLAAGTFVNPRRTTKTWRQKPNGLGGAIRLFNPSKVGELDIIVSSTHVVHQQLLALADADYASHSIKAPMIVSDGNTRSTIIYTDAYIITKPDAVRASSSVDIVWVFAFTRVEDPANLKNHNVVGT